MDAFAPDPVDALWSPEQRAAARERCRERAIETARATVDGVPADQQATMRLDLYAETIAADWLRAHDAYMERARQILGAPEAADRQRLARHLVLNTQHSALAAIMILRGAGSDVAALPVGVARQERVRAIRRAAQMETSA